MVPAEDSLRLLNKLKQAESLKLKNEELIMMSWALWNHEMWKTTISL